VSATRPYVDRPVIDRELANATAARQADAWGLSPPRLLRHGMNSLYASDGIVLRVGAATAPAEVAHRMATWLLEHEIPTVPPRVGLTADVDGLAVTGWTFVRETRQAIDWFAVGEAVRRVHALPLDEAPTGYPIPEPSVFPWWQFDEMLADLGGDLDGAARDGLRNAIERHRGWQERIRVRPVLCHGDVHPGNVMTSGRGPLLIDWDLMCSADPAWDHAMLSVAADRWGGDPRAYERFAAGYGAPPIDGRLATALGELRNVAATLMCVRAGRTDPHAAEEAERRLRSWRGDRDAPIWRAR
jgi:aminoglycoside phosphotransferase (APT) family kinase protein